MASGIRFARMARKAASARCSTASPLEFLGRSGINTTTPLEVCRRITGVLPDMSSRDMLMGKAPFSSSTRAVGPTGVVPNLFSRPPCDMLMGKASYCSSSTSRHFGPIGPDGLPDFVDWRLAGAVTDVVDQGDCGCCWACTAVATVEAINFQKTGRLVKLSEQQLIDCVDVYANGCHGGSPEAAYNYIINNGGLVSDLEYPFDKRKNPVYKPVIARGVTIDGFESLDEITVFELKRIVAAQPVGVVVGADDTFMNYTGGVLDGPNYTYDDLSATMPDGSSLGHWVTVVGYGSNSLGVLLWLIKNSYSKLFGWYEGYMLLARETGRPGGAFGITRMVAYPLKSCGNRFCHVRSETAMGLKRS